MSGKLLGMYMHMHWGYNHPYAVRTWTLDDWRAYLRGITGLGFNLLQIWPMVDSMPSPPTPSDEAHLHKIGQVIEIAQREFGMTVWIVLCANTLGNEKAANYPFESRPYFTTERRINPANVDERRELMAARRVFLQPLIQADGFSIIDSDPGGYKGSPTSEFVQLLADHRALFDSLRPGVLLNYWMWQGWHAPDIVVTDEKDPLAVWRDVVQGMVSLSLEPWGLLACRPEHFKVTAALGLQERVLYYPYGVIEDEPSFPLTNCDLPRIEKPFMNVKPEEYPCGAMGNAQSHVLQLPHTYLFAQLGRARGLESVNLTKFAAELISGLGVEIAEGWAALVGEDEARLAAILATLKSKRAQPLKPGRLVGLTLDDPARFLDDLIAQLDFKLAAIRLQQALTAKQGIVSAARELESALRAWAAMHGFGDFYGGPFRRFVHPLLGQAAEYLPQGAHLRAALADFESLNGHHAPERHGALSRLLEGFRESLLD